jgi:hypothetical protein
MKQVIIKLAFECFMVGVAAGVFIAVGSALYNVIITVG